MKDKREERLGTSRGGWVCVLAGALVWLGAGIAPQQAQAQMSIPGQFAVNESGAATYSIPIEVPPGVAGLQPKLSLDYNSQGGNGLLGVGWSLGGLSAITRCPRRQAQDGVRGSVNYDLNDRYCLDGQRLMAISGSNGSANSEYRTELESYSKVVAYGSAGNGPQYFIAQTKAGLTLEYGRTADSRIEAQGKSSVAVWAVNKITDAKGNALTVAYTKDGANGSYRPVTISYGGTVVAFVYEDRPDVTQGFHAGSQTSVNKRLMRIDISEENSNLYDYRILYESASALKPSRPSQVNRCSVDGNCLLATRFENGVKDFSGFQVGKQFPNNGYGLSSNNYMFLGGDFDGDGRSDLIHFVSNDHAHVWLSRGDGTFEIKPKFPNSGYGVAANNYKFLVGDFDGDGRSDLIHFVSNDYVHVWLSRGDGTFEIKSPFPNDGYGVAANDYKFLVGDFNGDGRSDLIHFVNGSYVHVWLSRGDGTFSIAPLDPPHSGYGIGSNNYKYEVGDFNGDGLSDLIHFVDNDYVRIWFSKGDGTFEISSPFPKSGYGVAANNYNYLLADFNGDGKTDLIHFVNDLYAHVWLSRGDGTFDIKNPFPSGGYSLASNNYSYKVGDFNGDGMADLVHFVNNDYIHVWLSRGDGTFEIGPQFKPWAGYSHDANTVNRYHFLVADFEGRGQSGMVHFVNNDYLRSWSPISQQAGTGIASISSDDGLSWSMTYKPLTDAGVYTKGSGSSYPRMDVQMAQYVVSQSRVSNGLGGTNATNYSYGELRAEQGTGRGSLGFRWVKAKEEATGLEHHTEYSQDWPFVGSPTVVETRLAGRGNAGLLKRIANSYQQQAGSHSSTRFVYAATMVETSWDLNGAAFPTVTTTSSYNNWGDATQIKVATSDGGSITTANEYLDANTGSGKWILGRLKKASVTHITP